VLKTEWLRQQANRMAYVDPALSNRDAMLVGRLNTHMPGAGMFLRFVGRGLRRSGAACLTSHVLEAARCELRLVRLGSSCWSWSLRFTILWAYPSCRPPVEPGLPLSERHVCTPAVECTMVVAPIVVQYNSLRTRVPHAMHDAMS